MMSKLGFVLQILCKRMRHLCLLHRCHFALRQKPPAPPPRGLIRYNPLHLIPDCGPSENSDDSTRIPYPCGCLPATRGTSRQMSESSPNETETDTFCTSSPQYSSIIGVSTDSSESEASGGSNIGFRERFLPVRSCSHGKTVHAAR